MFLGVDGGGTKTAFCLVDRDGKVAGQARTAGSYYFSDASEGIGLVERALRQGVDSVCADAGIKPSDIAYAFFGLPGYGEAPGDVPILDAAPRAVLGHDRYACDNDTVCGWAGSLGAADGINILSGTGSMTYGERSGRELALLVHATRDRLGFEPGELVPVSYSGGAFKADAVLKAFTRDMTGYDLRHPLYEPVIGAALYAAKLAGTPLDRAALDRLRSIVPSKCEVGTERREWGTYV